MVGSTTVTDSPPTHSPHGWLPTNSWNWLVRVVGPSAWLPATFVTRALNSMTTNSLFGSESLTLEMPVLKKPAPVVGSVVMADGGTRNVGVTELTFVSLPATFSPPVL